MILLSMCQNCIIECVTNGGNVLIMRIEVIIFLLTLVSTIFLQTDLCPFRNIFRESIEHFLLFLVMKLTTLLRCKHPCSSSW